MVENVSQHLRGVAHGVRAVHTTGGIGGDTGAVGLVLAANVAVDGAVARRLEIGGAHTAQRVVHALTQVAVGRRGQDVSGLPSRVDGRAGGSGVGGSVGVHRGGGGAGSIDTRAERGVVLQSGNALGVDLADQTCKARYVSNLHILKKSYSRKVEADSP